MLLNSDIGILQVYLRSFQSIALIAQFIETLSVPE